MRPSLYAEKIKRQFPITPTPLLNSIKRNKIEPSGKKGIYENQSPSFLLHVISHVPTALGSPFRFQGILQFFFRFISNNWKQRWLMNAVHKDADQLWSPFRRKRARLVFPGRSLWNDNGRRFFNEWESRDFFLSKRSRHLRYSTVRIYWPRESLTEKRAITYGKSLVEPIYIWRIFHQHLFSTFL